MATLDSDDLTAIDNLLAARGLPAVTLVKTSDNAASIINAAAAGSLIVLAPGTHTLSAAIELENDDVTIQGFGNATVVSSTVDGVPIRTFADNLTLRDFKLYSRSGGLDSPGQGIGYNTTTFPSGVTGCKNLRIKNITIDCLKDGIMFFPANSDANAIIEDCHILSTDSADAAVDIHLTANAVVSLRDCVIEASNDIGLLNEGAGTIEMLGGRVITPGSSQFSIVQSLTSTMIVSDETIYDSTKSDGTITTIKRNLTANAISAVTAAGVTITPTTATIESRAGKNYILAYTSETNSISVTVLDAGGNAVDLSAKTLGVYWETDAKVSVASLTSGITVSGAGNNVVTFAIPSAVTSEERELIFAIRDQAAPKALYAGGVFDVEYLPAG